MIEENEILLDSAFENQKAFWWTAVCDDTNDIAVKVNEFLEYGVNNVSLPSEIVKFIWPLIEKARVNIYTRYDFPENTKNIEDDFDKLVQNINTVFKQGAKGVQLFVKMSMFEKAMDLLSVVRNELFFGHELCICMDINDIDIHKWDMIFEKLRFVRASTLGITLEKDIGKKSDFIGRIYSMLDNWNFDGNLNGILINNPIRIDQIMRLTESVKPELYKDLKFFLKY